MASNDEVVNRPNAKTREMPELIWTFPRILVILRNLTLLWRESYSLFGGAKPWGKRHGCQRESRDLSAGDGRVAQSPPVGFCSVALRNNSPMPW